MILSALREMGVPALAIAIAVLLVRGAAILEKDANAAALRYISSLLKRDARSGGILKTLIPIVFDKTFGTKPLSFSFFLRSMAVSTTFWIILYIYANEDVEYVSEAYFEEPLISLVTTLILWYIVDWISLIKARSIMRFLPSGYDIVYAFWFFVLDCFGSIILAATAAALVRTMYMYSLGLGINFIGMLLFGLSYDNNIFLSYFREGSKASPLVVYSFSTIFTSMWTLLLFLSVSFARLMLPFDYIRQFTVWWYKDVDRRPLTAIAKVAAVLIVATSTFITAIRWLRA